MSLVGSCVLVTQSCLTLCDPTNCSLPGFSVREILQARILEWIAVPFSRGSSLPRDWTLVSCTAGRFFTICATRKSSIKVLVKLTKLTPGYTGNLKITQYLYSKRDYKNSDLSVQPWGAHCSPFMHTQRPLCAISTPSTLEKVQGPQILVSCLCSCWGTLLVLGHVQYKQDVPVWCSHPVTCHNHPLHVPQHLLLLSFSSVLQREFCLSTHTCPRLLRLDRETQAGVGRAKRDSVEGRELKATWIKDLGHSEAAFWEWSVYSLENPCRDCVRTGEKRKEGKKSFHKCF